MSNVPTSEREEAKPLFLLKARELQKYTIERCTHQIGKHYTFYIGTHLSDSAYEVYANAKRGNSIYPKNQHEAQLRRDYFIRAKIELENLTSQIELACEIIKYDVHYQNEWSALINKEIRLINGVLESDKERYQNLPDTGFVEECPYLSECKNLICNDFCQDTNLIFL